MNTYINNKSADKYWIVILLGALTAIGPISMDMYLPALPVVADDLSNDHISCTVESDDVSDRARNGSADVRTVE